MVLLLIVTIASAASAQTSLPTTSQSVDPALWQEMQQVDAQSANVRSLRGGFRQLKYTALMKNPLISTGTIIASGTVALWSTREPAQTQMLVSDKEIDIYYPQQSAEEIYPIAGKLGALASSPLPRLDLLKEFFTFVKIPAQDLDRQTNEADSLAIKLEPIDEQLKEHVRQVRVLLDRKSGLVKLAETIDPDGERTILQFANVQTNVQLSPDDLKLNIPAGTRVDHPLGADGGGTEPAPASPSSSVPH